jgi:hypothetical protein
MMVDVIIPSSGFHEGYFALGDDEEVYLDTAAGAIPVGNSDASEVELTRIGTDWLSYVPPAVFILPPALPAAVGDTLFEGAIAGTFHGETATMHISFGIGYGAVAPRWTELGAVLDANFASDQYYWGGLTFTSEAAFLTAVGGIKSGITRAIGPYIDPTDTNLVSNGGFANGTTGWAAGGTGASIAEVSGELELTASGNLNCFVQQISGLTGRAFRLRGTGRRGTSGNSFVFRRASDATLTSGESLGATISTTSATNIEAYFAGGTNNYIGARNTSASGSGTGLFDNISVVEAWPFLGWTHGAIAVAIEATAPVGAVADEVLFQADSNSEVARIRIVRQVADDRVVVIFTVGSSTQASLDLGVVADGASFGVAFSCQAYQFIASLNGGAPVTDIVGISPGASHLRIGRSFTGDTWTGTIERVTVF